MTINYYYTTFGFLVKKEDYLKYRGFTIDNIPKEYEPDQDYKDKYDDWQTHDWETEALWEWIADEHGGSGDTLNQEFEVDGVTYIVRGFTHDNKKYYDYVVVGLDFGSVDRWTGEKTNGTNCCATERIKTLAKNEDWIKMIRSSRKNTVFFKVLDYGVPKDGVPKDGVPDPKRPKDTISPTVFISTDDCECCS